MMNKKHFIKSMLTKMIVIGLPLLSSLSTLNAALPSQLPTLPIGAEIPTIVNDPVSGNVVAIWVSIDGDSRHVFLYSSIFSDQDGLWSTPQVISDSSTSISSVPALLINSLGNVLAVWNAFDFSLKIHVVTVATLPLTGTNSNSWSAPKRISASSEDVAGSIVSTIDSAGQMTVAWVAFLNQSQEKSVRVDRGIFNGTGGNWATPITLFP